MKSKLIGVIVVTVLAVSFSLTCLIVVNHAVGQMNALSMEALDLVDRGQTGEALAKMTLLASEWKKYRPFLEMLISHDEMHTVVERYTEAKASLERSNLDDFYKSMALLQENLSHLRDQEKVRWGNVL